MDPAFITSADWTTIEVVTTNLFRFAGFQILGALVFLGGHAVIPSLILSHHVSSRAGTARSAFYAVAVVALLIAWFSLGQAIVNLIAVLNHIYPRWAV